MTFVVSAGTLSNIDRSMSAPTFSVAIGAPGGLTTDYATIWRSQPNVRTCVDFLARNIAQLGLHAYRRQSDVDRKRITTGPLAQLIEKPNPVTTRYRFIDSLVHDLGIYDNSYYLKTRASRGNERLALYRLPPEMVTPYGEDTLLGADGYEVRGNRAVKRFPADQVIHFRGYNPHDTRTGTSPIETLRQTLLEEYQAARYREQLWRNGARIGGYIRRPNDSPNWSDKARARFRAEWQAQYTGEGPNAGGTPVLEDGMEWVNGGMTPEQAQYLEARKLTREEVASAFHIPLPMVGILEHATFSNIESQHKQLYQDTLGPWLTQICEELKLQLIPDLFPPSSQVYVEFNLAEKLRGSFEEQAQQLQTAIGAPWLTRNEGRARMNLPQIEGADELITPLNVGVGAVPEKPEPPPPPPAPEPIPDDEPTTDEPEEEPEA